MDDEEVSQAGTVVRFVNAIADAVAAEFPDKVIEMLAYQYSRKPPKRTRLRRMAGDVADGGRRLREEGFALRKGLDLVRRVDLASVRGALSLAVGWTIRQGPAEVQSGA